jgi:hypothetical protein
MKVQQTFPALKVNGERKAMGSAKFYPIAIFGMKMWEPSAESYQEVI